jgi:hypothetical protein
MQRRPRGEAEHVASPSSSLPIADRMAASRTQPLPIWAVDADLLVAGPKNRQGEEQAGESAGLAAAPGLQRLVHEGGGAADLGGGQAFEAAFGHDLQDIPRRHALDVHSGDGEHHRARGAPPSFAGLRPKRRIDAAALGDLDGQGACGGIDLPGLVTVGIAAALGRALPGMRADTALALDAHGEVQHRGERGGHSLGAGFDQLFHQLGDGPIVRGLHPVLLGKGTEPGRSLGTAVPTDPLSKISRPQDALPKQR